MFNAVAENSTAELRVGFDPRMEQKICMAFR